MGYVDRAILYSLMCGIVVALVLAIEIHWKIFYIKWIKGECRHFCFMCKYKNQCFDNLE